MAYVVCPNCAWSVPLKDLSYREKRKRKQLCARCPAKAEPGRSCCQPCLDRAAAKIAARRAKRRLEYV